MTETDLNGDCRRRILKACPHAKIYKHADQFTGGIPDTSVTWGGATSWLEFKHLEAGEDLHAKPGGTRGLKEAQRVELVKLEIGCGRAWLVVYRKASRRTETPTTTIYRPRALGVAGAKVTPVARRVEMMEARDLWAQGALEFMGYDHDAVVRLILQTHGHV